MACHGWRGSIVGGEGGGFEVLGMGENRGLNFNWIAGRYIDNHRDWRRWIYWF